MLLDAHSLIYRAWFALFETPLTTSKGQLVNAAFGFWSIVLRGFADMRPDHVICCFDVGRSFRADRYEGYNTPSLVGLYRKVRFLHSGRARDLERVVNDLHSPEKVNGEGELSEQEAADLIEFLKSL